MTSGVTVPPPPLVHAAPPPQLSHENLLELQAASARLRGVRRAISVARFDGWTLATFAAMTLVLGLTEPSSLVMGLGIGAVACVELRCADRLRRLDLRATRLLGYNQLAMGVMLIAYAVWRIAALLRRGGPYEALGVTEPQLAQMLQPVENLTRLIGLALYSALIAIGLFAQGGLAWFYFTREKHVRAYLSQTPPWIVGLQKAGFSF
jgi:hypothetical protein